MPLSKPKTRRKSKGPDPLRADPSRTLGLRKALTAEVRRRFRRLRLAVYDLIAREDALALNEGTRSYAAVMLRLDPGALRDLQSNLDPADVVKLEDDPHITVKYGLHAASMGAVRMLAGEGNVYVRVKGLSLFRNDDDVLKLDVDGEALHRLHSHLGLLPNTETYREYHPHITVAYLKPGTGDKYLGLQSPLLGSELLFKEAVLSDPDGLETAIALNRFCPTGPGGGVDPTCGAGARIADATVDALKAAGAKAAHIEHAAKIYVTDKIGQAVAALPESMQGPVEKTFMYAKVATQAAFVTWTASQAFAERVAKERGYTDEQARRLRGVLSTVDLATFKPVSIGLAATGVGVAALTAASLVPPATAGYLAYSTARDPVATWRAAKGVVADAKARVGGWFKRNEDILDRIAYADDTWIAVFLAACEEGATDPVAVADWARANTINSFCPTGQGGGVDPSCSPSSSVDSRIASQLDVVKSIVEQHMDMLDGVSLTGSWANPNKTPDSRGAGTSDIDLVIHPKDKDGARSVAWDVKDKIEAALKGTGREVNVDVGEVSQSFLDKKGGSFKTVHGKTLLLGTDRRSQLVQNKRWAHAASDAKVKEFQAWLKGQMPKVADEQLWQQYTLKGFQKGAGRAFTDTKQKGSQQQFLKQAFGKPVSVEKVKLVASRSFNDLQGVTDSMATQMTRTLADGLVEGKAPADIASDLTDVIDISEGRAETIARTEIIRAHAEGQLMAMEELGIDEVGAAVEWTALDTACPKCAPLDGIVLKVSEARGLLPRHPSCRCAWLPALDGGQPKSEVLDALAEAGVTGLRIGKDRPEGVFNVFCPTGPGGGVDPSCSPGHAEHLSASAGRYGLKYTQTQLDKIEHLNKDRKHGETVKVPKALSDEHIKHVEATFGAKAERVNTSGLGKELKAAGGMPPPAPPIVSPAPAPASVPASVPAPADTARGLKNGEGNVGDRVRVTGTELTGKITEVERAKGTRPENRTDRHRVAYDDPDTAKQVSAWHPASQLSRDAAPALAPAPALDRAATAKAWTEHTSKLPPKQGMAVREGMRAVVAAMSPKAFEIASKNMKVMQSYASTKELKGALKTRYRMPRGEVLGAYTDSGIMHIGYHEHEGSGGVSGTIAHEMGHAIDGGQRRAFSSSSMWHAAWRAEARDLSHYATTTPSEGFAEFSRMLHGSKLSAAEVKQKFPKMHAFWKDRDLV
jgi:SPP1 gp7 family putative phage head morphogenesis protein